VNDRRLLLALSVVAFGMAVALALGPLQGLAHVSDEVAYTLQAKLFAAGMRTGPPADEPSMMLYPFWQAAPRSYAVFPPGWPLLLALGVAVGLPWLVNALLAAALPPLTWLLARAWDRDEDEARLAATVAALSPGIVLLAGSRMPHTSVLVALLGAVVVVERRTDGARAWIAAALGLSYVVLARPFDALLLAGPLVLLGLWRSRGQLGRGVQAAWVLLPAAAAALVLLDNQHLTGHALSFPVGPWYDQWVADQGRPPGCNALGFGASHGCVPVFGSWGHSPQKAARIAGETLLLLDRFLLGLPGGLLVALVGALRVRRLAVPAWLTAAVILGYALYWSPGNVFGARFYHPLYVFLPIWVAAGLSVLPAFLRGWVPAVLLGLGCLVGLGRAAVQLMGGYWCVDGRVAGLLSDAHIDQGVVFLQGGGTRTAGWPWLGRDELVCDPLLASGSAFQLDDPTRQQGGLQLRHSLSSIAEDQAFMARYHPGARAWLLVHDLSTDHYRLQEIPAQ